MSMLVAGRDLALIRGNRLLFEGLDFSVAPGAALHITGPNGCGKSSLIRLVAGLLAPTAGTIDRAEAALADEGLALDRELPVQRALEFWGGPKLSDALRIFDLERLADVPVRLLSTGQRKRAVLARVVASGAPLWLLDEPLNGLDRMGIEQLSAAIAKHRGTGGGVIAASHLTLGSDWSTLDLAS